MLHLKKLSPILVSALLVACSQAQPMAQGPVLPEAQALVVQAGQGDRVARLNLQAMAPYALQQAGTVHRWVPGDVMHYEVELKQRSASDPNQYDAMGAGMSTQVPISGSYGAGSVSFTQLEAGRCYRAFVRAMGRVGGAGGSGNVVQLNTQAQNDHVDFDFTASNDIRSEISRSVTVQLDNTPFSGTGQLAFASPVPGSYLAPSAAPGLQVQAPPQPLLRGSFNVGSMPVGLSIAPDGSVWVGHGGDTTLRHLASDGSLLGNHDWGISIRHVVHAMPDGSVWAGAQGNLMHVASNGAILSSFNPNLLGILDIHGDSQGNLWVLGGNAVKKFGADGSLIISIPMMAMEGRMAISGGRLWVMHGDMGGLKLKSFNSNDGTIEASLTLPFSGTYPLIAAGAQGQLWMLGGDYSSRFIRHLGADGTQLGQDISIGHGNGLALGADGKLWVSNSQADQVLRMDPSGQVLASFNVPDPMLLKTGPQGAVWVPSHTNKVYLIR